MDYTSLVDPDPLMGRVPSQLLETQMSVNLDNIIEGLESGLASNPETLKNVVDTSMGTGKGKKIKIKKKKDKDGDPKGDRNIEPTDSMTGEL